MILENKLDEFASNAVVMFHAGKDCLVLEGDWKENQKILREAAKEIRLANHAGSGEAEEFEKAKKDRDTFRKWWVDAVSERDTIAQERNDLLKKVDELTELLDKEKRFSAYYCGRASAFSEILAVAGDETA